MSNNLEGYGKRFSDNLSLIRHKKKITRKQLADALQMTEIAFGNYERGRIPTIDKIFAIAEKLECSITDLLGDTTFGKREKSFNQRFDRARQILENTSCSFEENDEGKITVDIGKGGMKYIDDNGTVIPVTKAGILKIVFGNRETFVDSVESAEINALVKDYAFQNALVNLYENLPRMSFEEINEKEK